MKKQKAFTLLEVIIAATVLTIVLGTVITLLISAGDFYALSTVDSDLFNHGQLAMGRIKDQLKTTYRNRLKITTDNVRYYTVKYRSVLRWDTTANPPLQYSATSSFVWDSGAKTLTWNTGGSSSLISSNVRNFRIEKLTGPLAVAFSTSNRAVITLVMSKDYSRHTANPEWKTQIFREDVFILPEPKN